jgi:hypothetical protein
LLVLTLFTASVSPAQEAALEDLPGSGQLTAAPEDLPGSGQPAAAPEDLPGSGQPAAALEDLPGSRHLAAALSDPSSRTDTLMTLMVTAHLLEDVALKDIGDAATLAARFRADRSWLDRLALRYPDVPMRSSTLDASAWFLLRELDQHELVPPPLVSPMGPASRDLMRQVFDRSNERLAATFLPELLMRMEPLAPALWHRLLARASQEEAFLAIISGLNAEWFDPWMAAEPPAPTGQETDEDAIARAMDDFLILAGSAMREDPPDALSMKRLRFNLLLAIPNLPPEQLRDATQLLRLATAIDGLQDRRYLAFTETLLWVVADLLLAYQHSIATEQPELATENSATQPAVEGQEGAEETEAEDGTKTVEGIGVAEVTDGVEQDIPDGKQAGTESTIDGPLAAESPIGELPPDAPASALSRTLAELLPQLSNVFARDFSEVDPRINASLAAAFDIVQNLQDGPPDRARFTLLVRELADAIAQFVLLTPDMNFYFDQPARRRIAEEIDICTSIAAARDQDGRSTSSREQFDRCLASMVDLSETAVRSAELAGDPDGPFGAAQLQRELALTPWQRINYALGYLHERNPAACAAPEEPLPNPLEWSALATALVWFARQSPVYLQTPGNETLIARMRQQGLELLQTMEQQVDCFSGSGGGINDPVSMSLVDYRKALEELVAGIREAELTFRESKLAPGADIVLRGDASQKTAYRPEQILIGPCRPDHVCEMTGELEATRALLGLFPDHYLIADQTGLGKIEICYDNMQWVQRRAEPVRQDDPHVANFFGHLSFDLIGRYVQGEDTSNVFGSKFMSPDEYHYLFAAASDEVRDDSCPSEWVGSKIVTPLNHDVGFRVVPDRLTYLASARSKPSDIINLNWSRGSEWRDWFVTGLGVTRFEFEPDETIIDRINQHLQALYQSEQVLLYHALLRPRGRAGADKSISLFEEVNALTTAKALLHTQMNLFYPEFLLDSDEIRGSLEGSRSLIDGPGLRRFRDGNLAVESINDVGLSRFEDFRSQWSRQPEAVRRSGSVAISVAHAIARLNALYEEFFALPPEPAEKEERKGKFSGFGG